LKHRGFKILNKSTGKVVKSVSAKPAYPRQTTSGNNFVKFSVKRNGPININFPMLPR